MSTLMVPVPDVNRESSVSELETLFREHHQLIYRTAYSITGSHQDAEDVLQTIFLRLMKHDLSPELRSHPKTYLYRAAVNSALTIIRTRQRRRVDDAIDVRQIQLPQEESPGGGQLEEQLLHAIGQLDSRAVEILILRYEHNCSDAEIAKMLGRSRGAVAVALYRARARLRRLLRDSGEGQ